VDSRVDAGDDQDTGVGTRFSVVAHQVREWLVGRSICFVALDERLDGGRLRSRHFSCGLEGLR
jgi:hypothetical protein